MTIKITKQLADLIEDSIENTYQRVEDGREHLEKAATYQVNKLKIACCYIVCFNFSCVKHKKCKFLQCRFSLENSCFINMFCIPTL